MKLPVRGTNFVKDTSTGALLTVNPSVLAENEARKRLKLKLNSKNDEINKLKEQVNLLSQDIGDIKNILTQLIKRD
jgi:prefoldin subunit 5